MEGHSRRKRLEENRKKVKIKVLSVFICLFLVMLVLQLTSREEDNKEQETSATIEEDENEENPETEETKTEGEEVEVVVDIEPSESEEVKSLIETIKLENSLTVDNFSFFYYNLKTKEYYLDNGDKWFTAASTIKVPIAMLYYDKVNNKEVTFDTTYLYRASDYEEGDGMTAYTYDAGDSIPLSFLLEQMIEKSDNTATNVLTNALGGRAKYIGDTLKYVDEKIGLQVPENFYNENITSAKYGHGIMNYIYNHPEEYAGLIDHMKKSSYGSYLKKYITDYDVAHKYGSYEGNIHDYGIVYGKEPYLIGVFTKSVPDAEELIANISLQVLNLTLQETN